MNMRVETRLRMRRRNPTYLGARLSRIQATWEKLDAMSRAITNNDFTNHPELDPSQLQGEAYIRRAAGNSRFVQLVLDLLKPNLSSKRGRAMSRLARQVEATFQAADRGMIPYEMAVRAELHMHEILKKTALPKTDELVKQTGQVAVPEGSDHKAFSPRGTIHLNGQGDTATNEVGINGEMRIDLPVSNDSLLPEVSINHPAWVRHLLGMSRSWNLVVYYIAAEVKAGRLSRLNPDPTKVLRSFLPDFAQVSLDEHLLDQQGGVTARRAIIDKLVDEVAGHGVASNALAAIRAHFIADVPLPIRVDEPAPNVAHDTTLHVEVVDAARREVNVGGRVVPIKSAKVFMLLSYLLKHPREEIPSRMLRSTLEIAPDAPLTWYINEFNRAGVGLVTKLGRASATKYRFDLPIASAVPKQDLRVRSAEEHQGLPAGAEPVIERAEGGVLNLTPYVARLYKLIIEASTKPPFFATSDYLCNKLWPGIPHKVSSHRLGMLKSYLNKKLEDAHRPQIVNIERGRKKGIKYIIPQGKELDGGPAASVQAGSINPIEPAVPKQDLRVRSAEEHQGLPTGAKLAIDREEGGILRLTPQERQLYELIAKASAKAGSYATSDYLCNKLWPGVPYEVSSKRLGVLRAFLNKKLANAHRPQIVNIETQRSEGVKYIIPQDEKLDSVFPESAAVPKQGIRVRAAEESKGSPTEVEIQKKKKNGEPIFLEEIS